MSAQRIEADLKACTDSFVNLVRAARIGDESAASKKRKVTLPTPFEQALSFASCSPSSKRSLAGA